MNSLSPSLSEAFLCFVASEQIEYELEFALTRGKRCVLTATNPTWMDKIGLRVVALQIRLADKAWEEVERDFLKCFDVWRQGDEALEEHISDHPDDYYHIEIKEIIKSREHSQKKLILLGEAILNMSDSVSARLGTNPFLDGDKIRGVVRLLRDDLENDPSPYFQSILDEERGDESQRTLGIPESTV